MIPILPCNPYMVSDVNTSNESSVPIMATSSTALSVFNVLSSNAKSHQLSAINPIALPLKLTPDKYPNGKPNLFLFSLAMTLQVMLITPSHNPLQLMHPILFSTGKINYFVQPLSLPLIHLLSLMFLFQKHLMLLGWFLKIYMPIVNNLVF